MIKVSILPIGAQDSIDLEFKSSEIIENYDVIPNLFYSEFKYNNREDEDVVKRFDSVYLFAIESNHLEGDVIIIEDTIEGLLIANNLILSLIYESDDFPDDDELNVNFFIQEYASYEDAYSVALVMRENNELCYDKGYNKHEISRH